MTEIGSVASEGSGAVTGGTGTWYKKAAFDEAACALAAVQPESGAGDGNRRLLHSHPQHFDLKGTWSGQRDPMSDTDVEVYQSIHAS